VGNLVHFETFFVHGYFAHPTKASDYLFIYTITNLKQIWLHIEKSTITKMMISRQLATREHYEIIFRYKSKIYASFWELLT
jgi:hypothetical protein